jgi:hypothetical protein
MLRNGTFDRETAHRPTVPVRRTLAAALAIGALTAATLTACADQLATAPVAGASEPQLMRNASASSSQSRGPTRIDVPDATQDFTIPAGVACSFAVRSEPLVNRLVTKRFPADASGDVLELTTGTLVVRYTNVPTGKSITLKVSGPGQFTIHPDGSQTLVAVGTWTTFGLADGQLVFWLTSGRVVVELPADGGLPVIVSQAGRAEDICTLLS